MELFKGKNLLEFAERFKTDLDCKEYLADLKWKDSFSCVKCAHTGYQIRKDHSRTCNRCGHTESATSNTLFHKVKFGIRKAFFICFEMSTTTKSLSANYVADRFGITEKTARLFMHKVREAMRSSEQHPMDGNIEVDEFVLGGQEKGKIGRSYDAKKKKAVCAVEYTDKGKIKRMYTLKIDDFSSKELKRLFDKHISKNGSITTDSWRGYRPLMNDYAISQIGSESGTNFQKLHTMIHQIKSWIRTTYSWVSEFNVDRYFSEFCYRLNRSRSKNNIFNNLIERMVNSDKIYQEKLVCN
ncbi:MAG: IS1595 family transposase [Flavobacteriales bacterium]